MNARLAPSLQVVYVNTTTNTTWVPGEQRTFYLYAAPAALDMRGSSCIPFRWDGPPAGCAFAVHSALRADAAAAAGQRCLAFC